MERFGWNFCPGDKVMQVANDYERKVFNGDLGVITAIDVEEAELTVSFEGRTVTYGFGELDELVLGYATTIHKSQGSEYPAVVIPLSAQHYAMLARNRLYTGVTRGKRLVVLVGQRHALAIAVRNQGGTAAMVQAAGVACWMAAVALAISDDGYGRLSRVGEDEGYARSNASLHCLPQELTCAAWVGARSIPASTTAPARTRSHKARRLAACEQTGQGGTPAPVPRRSDLPP